MALDKHRTRLGAINLDAFEAALAKFRDALPEMMLELYKDFSKAIFAKTIIRTPVLTGRAQHNWHITLGGPSGISIIATASTAEQYLWPDNLSMGLKVIDAVRSFQAIIWINNNVAYIQNLEEGSSQQAPEGMLAISIVEASEELGGYVDALDHAISLEDLDDREAGRLGY